LTPPDAIHLITAKVWGATEFHTYDDKLYRHAKLMGFDICHPRAIRMPLFPRRDSPLRNLKDTQGFWKSYVRKRRGRS
jgi:hypothetical protein